LGSLVVERSKLGPVGTGWQEIAEEIAPNSKQHNAALIRGH
jgi:hypothetical protein